MPGRFRDRAEPSVRCSWWLCGAWATSRGCVRTVRDPLALEHDPRSERYSRLAGSCPRGAQRALARIFGLILITVMLFFPRGLLPAVLDGSACSAQGRNARCEFSPDRQSLAVVREKKRTGRSSEPSWIPTRPSPCTMRSTGNRSHPHATVSVFLPFTDVSTGAVATPFGSAPLRLVRAWPQTAAGFLALARASASTSGGSEGGVDSPPVLFDVGSELGDTWPRWCSRVESPYAGCVMSRSQAPKCSTRHAKSSRSGSPGLVFDWPARPGPPARAGHCARAAGPAATGCSPDVCVVAL